MHKKNENIPLSLLKRYWQDTSIRAQEVPTQKFTVQVDANTNAVRKIPKFNIADKNYQWLYPNIFGDDPTKHRVFFKIKRGLSVDDSPIYSIIISILKKSGVKEEDVNYVEGVFYRYDGGEMSIPDFLIKIKRLDLVKKYNDDKKLNTLLHEEEIVSILSKILKTDKSKIDYRKGIIDRPVIKTEQKIGKNLISSGKEQLAKLYAEDPFRQAGLDQTYAVLSRHPYDILTMSTGRAWTSSCLELIDGGNRFGLSGDVKAGTIVAYLVTKDDINKIKSKDALNNPLARLAIKPFFASGYLVPYLKVPSRGYGDWSKDFITQVAEFINRKHNKLLITFKNSFKLKSGAFHDHWGGDPSAIDVVGTEDSDKMLVYKRNGGTVEAPDVGIIKRGAFYGYTKDGKLVLPYIFNDIKELYLGGVVYLAVKRGGKFGLYNVRGDILLDIEYDAISAKDADRLTISSKSGYPVYAIKDKQVYTVLVANGEVVITAKEDLKPDSKRITIGGLEYSYYTSPTIRKDDVYIIKSGDKTGLIIKDTVAVAPAINTTIVSVGSGAISGTYHITINRKYYDEVYTYLEKYNITLPYTIVNTLQSVGTIIRTYTDNKDAIIIFNTKTKKFIYVKATFSNYISINDSKIFIEYLKPGRAKYSVGILYVDEMEFSTYDTYIPYRSSIYNTTSGVYLAKIYNRSLTEPDSGLSNIHIVERMQKLEDKFDYTVLNDRYLIFNRQNNLIHAVFINSTKTWYINSAGSTQSLDTISTLSAPELLKDTYGFIVDNTVKVL